MKLGSNQFKSIVSGNPNAIQVVNGDVNSAIRGWKKFTKNAGIISTLKEKSEFISKSFKKHRQKESAKHKQWLDLKNDV